MSRTYRKPLRVVEENEENYIKRQLSGRYTPNVYDYGTKMVRRKKPKEVYDGEYEKAYEEYHAKLKKASYDDEGRPYDGYRWGYNCAKYGLVPNYIREPYVSRYYYVKVQWSLGQEIESLRNKYAQFSRDGHWNETGRNTGFKKAAAKTTRRANKRLEKKIVRDDSYDHLAYPNHHDGDHLVWSFW